MFYRTGVFANKSFTLQEYGFRTFAAPVTLTRRPSNTNLIRIPSRNKKYQMCVNNFYVKAFESYRWTDIHTDAQIRLKLYTTPPCRWTKIKWTLPGNQAL